ncbi:DUF5798 family protein [Salinibaculum rarum]|jgi:chromosome segregation ATPase|uniref:DUF5798 family protein n=1 Tax=Salinibaculum rarum TaxID=3058903 RepID=UPI00265EF186|nr:DUF5798 family protein [Salinibaculum sp. KK48]
MGLGGTAKKLQTVMDSAEKLYAKMNEIIGELKSLQQEVEDTSEQVDRLERDLAEQRALVEALAADRDIDVEAILEDADLPQAPDTADADETADDTAGTDVPVTDDSDDQ